jgi:hypothetical protein
MRDAAHFYLLGNLFQLRGVYRMKGDSMQKLTFILSIFTIALLLTGCAGQPVDAKSLQGNQKPTVVPAQLAATETPQAQVLSSAPPKDCPITIPQDPPFTPPAPYSPESPWSDYFWYGTNSLWTVVPRSGVWRGLPHNPEGYTQKVFWWREGYVWNEEPQPEITVTAERLDASAPSFAASGGTNAYADDIGSAMLTGVDFPTLGCWKITGKYKDAELSFVVWVAP